MIARYGNSPIHRAEPGTTFVVLAGVMHPGDGLSRARVAITVRDGRIASISDAGAATPAGVRVIDALDAWVIPGLVDAHAHLAGDRDRRRLPSFAREREEAFELISVALTLEDHLGCGVTRLRAAGGLPDDLPLAAREAITDGLVKGPGIVVSARVTPRAKSRVDLQRQARRAIGEGADSIIAGGCNVARREFSDGELRLLADESHRRGSRIGIRAVSVDEAIRALNARFDGVEGIPPGDGRRLVEALDAHGAYLIPLYDPNTNDHERALTILSSAVGAGLRVAAGSCLFTSRSGLPLAATVGGLIAAGADASAVMRSVTVDAAWAVGMETEFGQIAEGQSANLIVLTEDPALSPDVLGDPSRVREVVIAGMAA